MLGLLPKAFPEQMAQGWEARIKEIVPSYGRQINSSPALTNEIRRATSETLQLPYIEVPADLNHPNPAQAMPPVIPAAPAANDEQHLSKDDHAM